MENKMTKFSILYTLNEYIKIFDHSRDNFTHFSNNRKLIVKTKEFLDKLNNLHSILEELNHYYYYNTDIINIYNIFIKELINIESYTLTVYTEFIEDISLKKFLNEYEVKLKIISNNLTKFIEQITDIKKGTLNENI